MEKLHDQLANKIESFFAKKNFPVHVTGGKLFFRRIQFCLSPLVIIQPDLVTKLSKDLSKFLGFEILRITWRKNVILIDIPKQDFEPVKLLSILNKSNSAPQMTATLGVTEDGYPLMVELSSPKINHVLILGDENAGKTNLTKAIMLSLILTMQTPSTEALKALEIVLFGEKFNGSYHIPSLHNPMINMGNDYHSGMKYLVDVTKQRCRNNTNSYPIIAVIDDLDCLVDTNNQEVVDNLLWLLNNGYFSSVFIIGASKYMFNSPICNLYDAFPLRIIGKLNRESSPHPSWLTKADASNLLGYGDFVAMVEEQLYPFQAAYLSPSDELEILGRLNLYQSALQEALSL